MESQLCCQPVPLLYVNWCFRCIGAGGTNMVQQGVHMRGMGLVDLFLEKQFFPFILWEITDENFKDRPFFRDIWEYRKKVCIFCLSVENCLDGKITIISFMMTQVNTNLHLIQSSSSWKVLNMSCVLELVPVISFSIVARSLGFTTHSFVNVDFIMLPFLCAYKH